MNELEQCNDLDGLFSYLRKKGILDRNLWRLFHCSCCHEIWAQFDGRMRLAVDLAERYVGNHLLAVDLRLAYDQLAEIEDAAWRVVESLKEQRDSSEWIWPISEAVDAAWVHYCAAGAAKCCALITSDDLLFTTIPDSAASVPAWLNARNDILQAPRSLQVGELRDLVVRRWQQIRTEEEGKQLRILRSLVQKRLQAM